MEVFEIIALLERNGLPHNEARVLAVFKDGRPRTSVDIEREALLRQPEVSVTMNALVMYGWFRQELEKVVGKGRPRIIYHLAKEYNDICGDIARERGMKIASMMQDLNALRAVA